MVLGLLCSHIRNLGNSEEDRCDICNFGGLNEYYPHRLICLNTCFQVAKSIGKRLGGVVLLEEMCHCRCALGFQKTHTIPGVPSL